MSVFATYAAAGGGGGGVPADVFPWARGISAGIGAVVEGVFETANPFPSAGDRMAIPRAATIVQLGVSIVAPGTNTSDAATTITVLVNGVPSTLSLSVPAATTGFFSAVGAVAVVGGDKLSFQIDRTGSTAGAFISADLGMGIQ